MRDIGILPCLMFGQYMGSPVIYIYIYNIYINAGLTVKHRLIFINTSLCVCV